ncbi:MAG: tyrosine-type recombinase/integrase [Solirubrobacteraceae bacterium]
MTPVAPTLQAFFTERLLTQRQVSPHTIMAYRDSLRLLLCFAQEQSGKPPSRLDFADLDAPLIGAFLQDLNGERGNSAATRNLRLAAIHSLFRYAALRHPEHAASIARVLAIPATRHRKTSIAYLDRAEIDALLAAPDRSTWVGRRDHAMLLLAIQTGVRVSELVNATIAQASLTAGANLRVIGKGNRERCAILTNETTAVLHAWLKERQGQPPEPLFPTRRGGPLTARAFELRLDKHTAKAARLCPTLTTKRITPHSLRHTNAMLLRAENVDIYTIALWLGHATVQSTERYLHADNKLKQDAIDRTAPLGTRPGRYRPTDTLLALLERL